MPTGRVFSLVKPQGTDSAGKPAMLLDPMTFHFSVFAGGVAGRSAETGRPPPPATAGSAVGRDSAPGPEPVAAGLAAGGAIKSASIRGAGVMRLGATSASYRSNSLPTSRW